VGWVYPGYWVLLLTRLIPMDGWLAGLAYAGLRDNGYKECVYVVGESLVHKVVMNTPISVDFFGVSYFLVRFLYFYFLSGHSKILNLSFVVLTSEVVKTSYFSVPRFLSS
jgi:hypothetical protein